MGSLNISLSDSLHAFVDGQVARGGYSTRSDYIRELLHRERHRSQLRDLLQEGVSSAPGVTADDRYFGQLRQHVDAARQGPMEGSL